MHLWEVAKLSFVYITVSSRHALLQSSLEIWLNDSSISVFNVAVSHDDARKYFKLVLNHVKFSRSSSDYNEGSRSEYNIFNWIKRTHQTFWNNLVLQCQLELRKFIWHGLNTRQNYAYWWQSTIDVSSFHSSGSNVKYNMGNWYLDTAVGIGFQCRETSITSLIR